MIKQDEREHCAEFSCLINVDESTDIDTDPEFVFWRYEIAEGL